MRLLLTCIAIVSLGCGGSPKPVTYSDHAKEAYFSGMSALEDGNYLDAIENFSTVKTKYPYSQYAALAEVKIADTYFQQDKYVEAIASYRAFAQRRPNHPEVAYVLFMIGEGYFEQQPSKFFLFPPSYEKDKGSVKDAVRAYKAYLTRFPEHEKASTAQKKLAKCRGELADFEMYVARFYLREERPLSAVGRLEFLHRSFADVEDKWALASLMLIDTYLVLERPGKDGEAPIPDGRAKAVGVAESILAKLPRSEAAKEARRFLNVVEGGGRTAPTKSAPQSAAEPEISN